MDSKVSYRDPTFAAIVTDYFGKEYRFQYVDGNWYVQTYQYILADFERR